MAIGSLAVLGPFIDYLRPAKSPYLLMVIAGTVSMLVTAYFADEGDIRTHWGKLFWPQLVGLLLFTFLAFRGKDEHSQEELEEQLRFSRALCIGTAMVCLPIGAQYAHEDLFLRQLHSLPVSAGDVFDLRVGAPVQGRKSGRVQLLSVFPDHVDLPGRRNDRNLVYRRL